MPKIQALASNSTPQTFSIHNRLNPEIATAIKILSAIGVFIITGFGAMYFTTNASSLSSGCALGLGTGLGILLLGVVFSHYKSKEHHEKAWEITLFAAILIVGVEGALINHFVAQGNLLLTAGFGALGTIGLALMIAAQKQNNDYEEIDQKIQVEKHLFDLQNSTHRDEAAHHLKVIARYDAFLRGDGEKLAKATQEVARFRDGLDAEVERYVDALLKKDPSQTRQQAQEHCYKKHRQALYAEFQQAQKTVQELEVITEERQAEICALALKTRNDPLIHELVEQGLFKGQEEEVGDYALANKNAPLVGVLIDKGMLPLEGLLNRVVTLRELRDARVALMIASKGGTSERLDNAHYEDAEWKLAQELARFNARAFAGKSEEAQAFMRQNLLWELCMNNQHELVAQLIPFYNRHWTLDKWKTFFTLGDEQGRNSLARAIIAKEEPLTTVLLRQWVDLDMDKQPGQLEMLFASQGRFSTFEFAALSGQPDVVKAFLTAADERGFAVPQTTSRNSSLLQEVLRRFLETKNDAFAKIADSLIDYLLTLSPDKPEEEIFALIETFSNEEIQAIPPQLLTEINALFVDLTGKCTDQVIASELPQRFPPKDYPKLYAYLFNAKPLIERAKREVNLERLKTLQEIAEQARIPFVREMPTRKMLIRANLDHASQGNQLPNLSDELMATHIAIAHRFRMPEAVKTLLSQIEDERRYNAVVNVPSKPLSLREQLSLTLDSGELPTILSDLIPDESFVPSGDHPGIGYPGELGDDLSKASID